MGQNKTVLFSTHILQEVEAICDRVIIINKGNIVADDRLANIKTSSGSSLRISFKEPLETGWLKSLNSVTNVTPLSNNSFDIFHSNASLARKEIMQLALDKNLNIVSIQEGGSLEEVFRQLTSEE